MTRQQTRRSISVRGTTYERIQTHCANSGRSVSSFIEEIVAERLDALGVPVPVKVSAQRQGDEVVAFRPITVTVPSQDSQTPPPAEPLGDFKGSNFTF